MNDGINIDVATKDSRLTQCKTVRNNPSKPL